MRPFEPLEWSELPESAQSLIPAEASLAVKLAAARSLVPMGVRELVSTLYFLASDPDRRVRNAARRSLADMPADMLRPILRDRISPKILNWFAHRDLPENRLYEEIALNRDTADETVAFLAADRTEEPLLNIVANNQERLLRSREILAALMRNEAVPIGISERVRAFVEMTTGKTLAELIADVSAVDLLEREAEEIEPPEPVEEPAPKAEAPPAESIFAEDGTYDGGLDAELPDDLDIDEILKETIDIESRLPAELLVDPEEELSSDQRVSLANQIRKMNVTDKMMLALKGNIEARQILIKSSNKLIQECVLRNNQISIEEVIKVAQNKAMREELVRLVANHRDWTRNYQVVSALCWNPKTPITMAMKFLTRLVVKDLQTIGKSKQVPGMLAVQARKMAEHKQRFR